MRRAAVIWCGLAGVAASCGNGDKTPDANVAAIDSAPPRPDAVPVSCGCPDAPAAGNCVSVDVFEWVDRVPVGPADGLAVYVVDELDYDQHTAPLAMSVPDDAGRAVIEGFTPIPGHRTYIVLDDANGSASDDWTHTGVGPIGVPGIAECVEAPALSLAHGDTFLTDAGYPPDEPPILGGTVILEVVDQDGAFRDLIGIETAPIVITNYFTADRAHVDRFLTSTTEAGAAFTGAATFCSTLCRNITCGCGDPTCGEQPADRGGTGNGFLFAKMRCDR